MLSNYIVRSNGLHSFYFKKDAGIVWRTYGSGKWGRESVVFPDARENYTVSLDADGVIYLFCQDSAGDIILCANKDGEFKPRPILKNKSNKIYTLQLNPIITQGGICLIYNLPEDDGNYIAMQRSTDSGTWSQPTRIDRFMSLSDSMFVLQQVSGEHHILFYQNRGGEISVGYREVTPSRQGAYRVFHSVGYGVIDTSFLTTEAGIHVLYVVKAMFSNQLIYRKKESGEFGEPVVLCEGQKLENCLLWCVNDRIYASFVSGEQLYVCVSGDGGKSFSRPERYRNKFCLNPVKAVYVSAEPMDESRYYLRQVYVDRNNPYDIQLLPDMYDDFYPPPAAEKTPPPDGEIDGLRNELELLRVKNREQEYQISYLTELLRK